MPALGILLGLTLFILPQVASALRLAVVSKIIVDTIDGQQRLGGGGVQAAVGARLGGASEVALHAPVGSDFDFGMLGANSLAAEHKVDMTNVVCLAHVDVTPGEVITYYSNEKRSFSPVGWDGWPALCEWEPQLCQGSYDALHAIVEGAGAGEVGAVLKACADAEQAPFVSVEPVMHNVTGSSVDGLCRLTRYAGLVSPDLATALCIRDACADGADADAVCLPGSVDEATLAKLRKGAAEDGGGGGALLLDLASTCFDELCMQPGALLAIRDGAHGAYLYTRPAPTAPLWQWLASGHGNRVHQLHLSVTHSLHTSGRGNRVHQRHLSRHTFHPEPLSSHAACREPCTCTCHTPHAHAHAPLQNLSPLTPRVASILTITFTGDHEWLTVMPAVPLRDVADPTGAGNAFAGALCAQLASGAEPLSGAATATAVGAAFCRTADWAPPDAAETRRWVEEQAAAAEARAAAE